MRIIADITDPDIIHKILDHIEAQCGAGRAALGKSALGATQHRQGHHTARCAGRRLHLLVELDHGRCRSAFNDRTNEVTIAFCFEILRVCHTNLIPEAGIECTPAGWAVISVMEDSANTGYFGVTANISLVDC
jgi:hypothetical protein